MVVLLGNIGYLLLTMRVCDVCLRGSCEEDESYDDKLDRNHCGGFGVCLKIIEEGIKVWDFRL